MNSTLEEFLFFSRKAQTVNKLFSLYEGLMESYGFDRLAYAITSDHEELKNGHVLGLAKVGSLNNWENYYLENNYIAVDPLVDITHSTPGIFHWNEIAKRKGLSEIQLKVFKDAEEEAGLFHGVSFSVHGPSGAKGVTLACSSQLSRKADPLVFDMANLATYQYHLCYLALMNFDFKRATPLSCKEEEILKWAAKGLTKSEIAHHTNISRHTVDYHVRNILTKLDAKNTTAALVTAIKEGLVI
ncbi:LuxR family transcriptional regulator [Exilibacterium tricleocarpae]|nr:LuxR family transcriptional regulator [Exilibacterium tricleocarpae]